MCLGSTKSVAPAAPTPPAPPPPRTMTKQATAVPATATGKSRGASENVENIRKGRKVLKIPLLEGAGTGVQISN